MVSRPEPLGSHISKFGNSNGFYVRKLRLNVMRETIDNQHWVSLELPNGVELNIPSLPESNQARDFVTFGLYPNEVAAALRDLVA